VESKLFFFSVLTFPLIKGWKVQKATGLLLTWKKLFKIFPYPWLDSPLSDKAEHTEEEKKFLALTQNVDKMAMKTLTLLLFPLVLGLSVHSLLMSRHASWYSWLLSVLTATVYGFGFALMTPQLIINHRLKSVAQLPWRFLCYR